MKANIVDEVFGGVVDRCVHRGDFLGHRREVFFFSALGRERRQIALKQHARLEHLPRFEAVQRAEQAQRRLPNLRRSSATNVPTPWRTFITPIAAR